MFGSLWHNKATGERDLQRGHVNWNDIEHGVDDVHLNQGDKVHHDSAGDKSQSEYGFSSSGSSYQDGALFAKMTDGSWTAAFFRFEDQNWNSD